MSHRCGVGPVRECTPGTIGDELSGPLLTRARAQASLLTLGHPLGDVRPLKLMVLRARATHAARVLDGHVAGQVLSTTIGDSQIS